MIHNGMALINAQASEIERLKAERDAAQHALSETLNKLDLATANNAALLTALTLLTPKHDDMWQRNAHEKGCPWLSEETRDCECDGVHVLSVVAAARATPHPGAALLEEHRKALVRAGNAALWNASAAVRAASKCDCGGWLQCSCNWERKLDGAEDVILALREPQP